MARRLTNSFDCFMVIETVGLFSRPFLPKNGSFPLQQRMADQILTQLKQHPDAWTRVDTILEYSNNQQTKVRWTENLLLFFKRFFNDIYIYVCVCVCFFYYSTLRYKYLRQSSRRDGKFSQQSSAKVRNLLILLHELSGWICYFSFISWKSGRFQMSILFLLRNKKVHCWFDNKNFFWSWYVRGECFVSNFWMEINVWLNFVLINHCVI